MPNFAVSKDKKFFEMLKQEDRREGPGFDINILIHYFFWSFTYYFFCEFSDEASPQPAPVRENRSVFLENVHIINK